MTTRTLNLSDNFLETIYPGERTIPLSDTVSLKLIWQIDPQTEPDNLGTWVSNRSSWVIDRYRGRFLGERETVEINLPSPGPADNYTAWMEDLGYTVNEFDSDMPGWRRIIAEGYKIVRDDLEVTCEDPVQHKRYYEPSYDYVPPSEDDEISYILSDWRSLEDFNDEKWHYMMVNAQLYVEDELMHDGSLIEGVENEADPSDIRSKELEAIDCVLPVLREQSTDGTPESLYLLCLTPESILAITTRDAA